MGTVRDLLRVAQADLGYRESPPGSNRTKFGAWFGLDGQPWCMMAVQFWCHAAGVPLPARTASCGALMRAAQSAGQWVTADFHPGDLLIYDFPGGAATDHVGVCESVGKTAVTAIEGNTALGNDANGGGVLRRTRALSLIRGACRPQFTEKEETAVIYEVLTDVPPAFRGVIQPLMDAGIIRGDGSDSTGNGDRINLTGEQVRTLVFVYRGGGFDRRLIARGLPPAVPEK